MLTALPPWGLLARYHPLILRYVAPTSTASSVSSAHAAHHQLVSQTLGRLIQEILLLGSFEAWKGIGLPYVRPPSPSLPRPVGPAPRPLRALFLPPRPVRLLC